MSDNMRSEVISSTVVMYGDTGDDKGGLSAHPGADEGDKGVQEVKIASKLRSSLLPSKLRETGMRMPSKTDLGKTNDRPATL